MLSEIFPSNLKGVLYGVITGVSWSCKMIVTFSFPFIFATINEYTFLIFSGYLIVGSIIGIFVIQETKGKSLEELTSYLK